MGKKQSQDPKHRKAIFWLFMGTSVWECGGSLGKLPSEIKERTRDGGLLKTLFSQGV